MSKRELVGARDWARENANSDRIREEIKNWSQEALIESLVFSSECSLRWIDKLKACEADLAKEKAAREIAEKMLAKCKEQRDRWIRGGRFVDESNEFVGHANIELERLRGEVKGG